MMHNERYQLNKNLAQMLKGGVIMDVTTPEQAKVSKPLRLTILMKVKCSLLQMTHIT